MDIVIKSQQTKTGVKFRVYKSETKEYLFYEVPFQNYFYIKKDDYQAYESEFLTDFKNLIPKIEIEGQFIRIYMANNFMRNQLREWWETRAKTYEADINANKRFLLDKKIVLHNEYIPYTFFDIETDDRKPLIKDEKGMILSNNQRILSFSGVDYNNEKYTLSLQAEDDDSEKELLVSILKYFSCYGCIVGQNSYFFDMPYIKQRCDKLGVDYSILEYINHLDWKDLVEKYYRKSLKSYSLNFMAKLFLNEQKIDQEKGNGAIYNTWKNDLKHLLLYNLEDSVLLYKMNQKLMFVEVSLHRANNALCHVQNTMNNSDSGDYYLLRKYKARNIIMPSKPTKEEIERRKARGKIGGGFTNCFRKGFFPVINVRDFKAMYPSTVITWNISPETYVDQCYKLEDAPKDYIITPCDFENNQFHPHRIFKKEIGVFPECAIELITIRDKIKEEMNKYAHDSPEYKRLYLEQYAVKVDANSYFYGLLSFAMGRYYIWEVGDTVTTCCRAMIKACYSKSNEWGEEIIGGDTDSGFSIPGPLSSAEIDNKFVEFLNDWTKQWGCTKHSLIFEYEKKLEPFIFVKKKNYAYIDEDGEIVIKGLESIKADSSIIGAKLQEELITDILKNKYDEKVWRDKLDSIYIRVFNQQLASAELLFSKKLTKMPKDYEGYIIDKQTKQPKVKNDGTIREKTIPAHVKLAKRMLDSGIDIYPGSKLQYIVVHSKPILALSLEEYNKKSGIYNIKLKKLGYSDYQFSGKYDANYYWLRIIKPVLKVIHVYYGEIPTWNWNIRNSEIEKIIGDAQDSDDTD